jgi:uncharacterized membrane protein (DUF373 family)
MVNEPPRSFRGLVHFIEASELVLYSAVAVLLIVIAIISLLVEIANIGAYVTSDSSILGLQELFITIIILELLMTVVGYMKRRSINLGLLLAVGLTAMIRKIITVGYPSTNYQEFALVLVATAILVAAIIFVGDRTIKA